MTKKKKESATEVLFEVAETVIETVVLGSSWVSRFFVGTGRCFVLVFDLVVIVAGSFFEFIDFD